MPTYEYVCGACSNEWEAEQSIKEAALTECPRCAKPEARRQISRGTGFILKGGGWYSDLYASSSNKAPEAKGESNGASKAETGESSSGSTSGTASSEAPAAPAGGTSGGSSASAAA